MHYNVIISGSGFAALLTAIALKRLGLSVLLLCDKEQKIIDDGRVFVLSAASKRYLVSLELWEKLKNDAESINDIVVIEEKAKLHYDADMVDEPMGYTIRASKLFEVLLDSLNGIDICYFRHKHIKFCEMFAEVTLADGSLVRASLVVCAEGKDSSIVKFLNIPVWKRRYNQKILTFVIEHELNHEFVALERFFKNGPFAVLPMRGGYKSSIILTDTPAFIGKLASFANSDIEIETKARMMSYLGNISIDGLVHQYDLSLSVVRRSYYKRVVFIADAAHVIHPVAGQGLNLGIRDIEKLSNVVHEYNSYGMDIGSNVLMQKYYKSRIIDTAMLVGVTDSIIRIFGSESKIVKGIRKNCITFINGNACVKKAMMKYAMGYVSESL